MNRIRSRGIGIGDKILEQLTETIDECNLIGSQVNDVNMPSDDIKKVIGIFRIYTMGEDIRLKGCLQEREDIMLAPSDTLARTRV